MTIKSKISPQAAEEVYNFLIQRDMTGLPVFNHDTTNEAIVRDVCRRKAETEILDLLKSFMGDT